MKKTLVIVAFTFIIGAVGAYAPTAHAVNGCIDGTQGVGVNSNKCFDANGNVIIGERPAMSDFGNPTAQGGGLNLDILGPYAASIINLINNILVPVLMAVAFVVFLYGVYKYFILSADSETERATGKQFVLWGIIGFVVIISVWGLVNIVKDTIIPSTVSTHPEYPTL